MKNDYYRALRLTPQATADEISAAYLRRALELNPDLAGFGNDAFFKLQQAYAVLSEPARRANHDRKAAIILAERSRLGKRRATAHEGQQPTEPPTTDPSATSFEAVSALHSFETFLPSFDEVSDRWSSNFTVGNRPKAEQLESLTVERCRCRRSRPLRADMCTFWYPPGRSVQGAVAKDASDRTNARAAKGMEDGPVRTRYP
jgi:curved DNA-binding protein CbpA